MSEQDNQIYREKIIIRVPHYVGSIGLLMAIVLGCFAGTFPEFQHAFSLFVLILGATLTILYAIADLYSYENPYPQIHKIIRCTFNLALSYMIISAIMYSYLKRGGFYDYYFIWLIIHSFVLLFMCFLPIILCMV